MGQKAPVLFCMMILLVGVSGCLSDSGLTPSPVPVPHTTHSYSPDYYS